MCSQKSGNSVIDGRSHMHGLQMAHAALQKSLSSPEWSNDHFYSAMAVYRTGAGVELGNDDDAMLDRWLEGADAVWKQEVKAKGDNISLAEALDKAIEGGMKAIGVRLGTQRDARGSF